MKNSIRKFMSGFTLLELLIAIAIVGILAAIAVPTYVHYVRKANYADIVFAAEQVKPGAAACLADKSGVLAAGQCVGGDGGVPANIAAGTAPANSSVESVTTTITAGAAGVANVIITTVPRVVHGFVVGDTYILTGTYDADTGIVDWVATGGGCTAGYATC